MNKKEKYITCPYCNKGVSYYSHPGFRWPCTICDGKGFIKKEEKDGNKEKSKNS